MTIKQLKEAIKDLPDNMDVMIHQTWDESPMSMVEQITVQDVTFGSEDIDEKEWATEKCLVLTDDFKV